MIMVVGDLVTDVVAAVDSPLATGSDTPARIRFAGGGQAANTAAWLAWLGTPVTLVAAVADIDAALAASLDVRHVHVSGYTLLDGPTREAGLRALAAARERGLTASVDVASAAPGSRDGRAAGAAGGRGGSDGRGRRVRRGGARGLGGRRLLRSRRR